MFKYFKHITLFTILVLLTTSADINDKLSDGDKVQTVVIDAGHGGHDSGCLGGHSQEKKIALKIALYLGGYIEKYLKDVKVIYTRKTDVFVELEERAAIANRNNADLFISIHCNAASPTAHGAETYVMGLHKNDGNLRVAQRENSVIELEDNYKERYGDFDPSSPESYILLSLNQNAYLEQSTLFASKVQEQFEKRVGLFNRGVKQAGFWVLWRTTMPSVLIESGFLTNSKEEDFLVSTKGQEYIASAIFRAFRAYKKEMENSAQEILSQEEIFDNPAPNISIEETKQEQKKEVSKEIQIVTKDYTDILNQSLYFKIQFMASKTLMDLSDSKYNGVENLHIEQWKTYNRYVSGPYDTFENAKKAKSKIKDLGFKDAFIVPYLNNERVSMTEVEHLIR